MVQEAEDLPGYQRGEPIHGSSTSAVYRARRAADGACVVVKRSHGSTVSAHQLTRYRNEYELLRSLDSDRVVKAHELVRHEGHVALILEDFAGCSLRRWIERASMRRSSSGCESPFNSLPPSPTFTPRTSFTRTSRATTSSTTARPASASSSTSASRRGCARRRTSSRRRRRSRERSPTSRPSKRAG